MSSTALPRRVSSAGYGYGDVYPMDYGYYSSDNNDSDAGGYDYVR
jgi:hypothetical protein